MVICLFYVATVMPFVISFVDESAGLLKFIEIFIDVMFIFDMVFNFFMAYWEEDVLIVSNKKIA